MLATCLLIIVGRHAVCWISIGFIPPPGRTSHCVTASEYPRGTKTRKAESLLKKTTLADYPDAYVDVEQTFPLVPAGWPRPCRGAPGPWPSGRSGVQAL